MEKNGGLNDLKVQSVLGLALEILNFVCAHS
jgi:hypothetical protein